MNIFQEMKERVTARQVAERYGLKVSRNGSGALSSRNTSISIRPTLSWSCVRG